MLKVCIAVSAFLVCGTATADWMKVFSGLDLPLAVVPGATKAVMSCSLDGPKSSAALPVDDMQHLRAWTTNQYRGDDAPAWAVAWSIRLEPLALYVGRVSALPSGEFLYGSVSEGAESFLQRTTQSDASAVDVAVGLASWSLQPTRMINSANEGGFFPLVQFDSDAGPALDKIWASAFVPRLPYEGIDTRVVRDAAATFEAFHALIFGDPVFTQPPPSEDSIRRSLVSQHSRTVAELQRFEDGSGEFKRWKTLEDVVHSLDRPDVEAGFEALKLKEEERLKSKLVDRVRNSLPSSTLIGPTEYPSTSELSGVRRPVSSHAGKCGVTVLEAKAIEMIGRLAYLQARLLVTRELSSGPSSFAGFGFGSGAAGLDSDAKELMRSFYPLAAASIARRTAYEFFWVYTYRIAVDPKTRRPMVQPILVDADSADTRKAKEEAAKLLNRIAGLSSPRARPLKK